MERELKWVCCDGGPHILMEKRLLSSWEGTDPPANGRVVEAVFRWAGEGTVATDYDRACDVNKYIGVIPVGTGQAIVIDDDVPMSAWLPGESGTGSILVLEEWSCDLRSADIIDAVRNLPDRNLVDTGLRYSTEESELLLFAAADRAPNWVYEPAEVRLLPGRYRARAANNVAWEMGTLRVCKLERE